MSTNITIVDYGVGNLGSLKKVFHALGVNAVLSEDAEELLRAEALVLPGVGAFASGMRGLLLRGLTDAVKRFAGSGKPLLGICLGAQLLLSKGFEFGEHEGLGVISGTVSRFPPLPEKEKVPHVGWTSVSQNGADWSSGIFRSFKKPFNAYFVHSYILVPEKKEHVFGMSAYGGLRFCSAVRKGNVFGTQFHPEKSGEAGIQIMQDFLELAAMT